MTENAKRDQNAVVTLLGVSSVDGVTPVLIYVDPVTHRVLVDSVGAITGSGTINEIAYFDSASTIASLTTATYPSLTELSYIKGLSSDLQTQLNGKQASLGFTPEDVANKSTNVTTDGSSDTKYPSVKAVKDYADGLVAGLLDYRGAYDASVNTFPASGGSGTAGAVLKGDMWIVSVAGTLGGEAVQVGDSLIANVDTPAQTASNWNILNSNISYVPEDVANKVTSLSGASTDTQYPSAKVTYDQLALKAPITSPTFQTSINGAFLTASEMLITDGSKNIVSAPVATYPSLTELSYIKGLSSAIQTQLNAKLALSGGTMTGNIQLGENTSIDLDPAGSADGKYSGTCITGTAGAALAFGDLIYLDPTDSRWELADANAASGADGDARGILGICVLAAAGDASATKILLFGIVRADTAFPAMTINAPMYVSETAGDITGTIPTTTDAVQRSVGIAITADELYFFPSPHYQTAV